MGEFWTLSGLLIANMVVMVLAALGIVLSNLLKGYGTKKGENVASKEDLQDLVNQVKAVTQATKEIETTISEQSSSRIRLLEMRREVAFNLTNLLGTLEEILIGATAEATALSTVEMIEPHHTDKLDDLFDQYKQVLKEMTKMKGHVALVFDEPVRSLLYSADAAASAVIELTNMSRYDKEKEIALILKYDEESVKLRLV